MLPVEVIGINQTTGGSNAVMYAGKRPSWIRDTEALSIEDSWTAHYRDVVILGPFNEFVSVYNLSLYNLQTQANRDTMKAMLIAAATPADTDHDNLPDFWEMNAYGNLTRTGASLDAGGLTVLQRYAHCGSGGGVLPDGLPRIVGLEDGSVSILYKRRRGTAFGLTVLPEFSRTLSAWESDGHGWEEWSVRTQYDGTCSELVEWKILTPGEWRNVRIRSRLP